MNKRKYQKPTVKVVKLRHRYHIMTGSTYETTGTGKTSITQMGEEEDL